MARIAQRGVSLIELMIGITISLIIMAGVIVVFVNITTSSSTVMKSTQLNNELGATLNLMVREVQKAGYVNAWDPTGNGGEGSFRLDAMDDFGEITLGNCVGSLCSCITYHYDRPFYNGATENNAPDYAVGDGVLEPSVETFGFRHNGNAIEMGTNVSCSNNINWQDVTSADVNVTELTFEIDSNSSKMDGDNIFPYEIEGDGIDLADPDLFPDCDSAGEICLDRRKIDVQVNAQLASDTSVSVTMMLEIKIRNDRYYTKI